MGQLCSEVFTHLIRPETTEIDGRVREFSDLTRAQLDVFLSARAYLRAHGKTLRHRPIVPVGRWRFSKNEEAGVRPIQDDVEKLAEAIHKQTPVAVEGETLEWTAVVALLPDRAAEYRQAARNRMKAAEAMRRHGEPRAEIRPE